MSKEELQEMKRKIKSLSELADLRKRIISNRDPNKPVVTICIGTGCTALGARKIVEVLLEEIKAQNLNDRVEVKETGCLGFCELGPRVILFLRGYHTLKSSPKMCLKLSQRL